jgi:hypothetical protein
MTSWDEGFRAISRGSTASFGADPYEGTIGDEYDDVIGAPGLEVTSSPTPKGPFTHAYPVDTPRTRVYNEVEGDRK